MYRRSDPALRGGLRSLASAGSMRAPGFAAVQPRAVVTLCVYKQGFDVKNETNICALDSIKCDEAKSHAVCVSVLVRFCFTLIFTHEVDSEK